MDATNSIYTWLESQGPEGAIVLAELRRLRDDRTILLKCIDTALDGLRAATDKLANVSHPSDITALLTMIESARGTTSALSARSTP